MNSSKTKIPVLVLFAPTASGKTALTVSLFGQSSHSFFKGTAEIISADSMQVYKGMDIGTAKPSASETAELPHHLISICSPHEQFSVSSFIRHADECCAEIWRRHKVPVIAGGTGFYIRSFLLGLPPTPPGDPEIRKKLDARVIHEGTAPLYAELVSCDPDRAARIHANDAYRIVRALEVYYITGRPLSSFRMPDTLRAEFDFCLIVLARSRTELYRRIDARVDQMFLSGLIEEYNRLVKSGCTSADPGMQAIGYRELASAFPYGVGNTVAEKQTLDKVKQQIKNDSRMYAKKQYTFMKDIPGASFCPLDNGENASLSVMQKITEFYSRLHLT